MIIIYFLILIVAFLILKELIMFKKRETFSSAFSTLDLPGFIDFVKSQDEESDESEAININIHKQKLVSIIKQMDAQGNLQFMTSESLNKEAKANIDEMISELEAELDQVTENSVSSSSSLSEENSEKSKLKKIILTLKRIKDDDISIEREDLTSVMDYKPKTYNNIYLYWLRLFYIHWLNFYNRRDNSITKKSQTDEDTNDCCGCIKEVEPDNLDDIYTCIDQHLDEYDSRQKDTLRWKKSNDCLDNIPHDILSEKTKCGGSSGMFSGWRESTKDSNSSLNRRLNLLYSEAIKVPDCLSNNNSDYYKYLQFCDNINAKSKRLCKSYSSQ